MNNRLSWAIPKPTSTSQRAWVDVQADIPLAWPDDHIMLAAETNPHHERLIEFARMYVARGHCPQLRAALAPGDSIRDYVAALDSPVAMAQLRRRSAVHRWNAGDAARSGGLVPPGGCDRLAMHSAHNGTHYRSPDVPYLRDMLAFTYPDEQRTPYRYPSPPSDDPPAPKNRAERRRTNGESADYQHSPMRGPGRQ